MFTGIIETLGKVSSIEANSGNIDFTIESNITSELKIDQSVSHNGVCLTVVKISGASYTVTAIAETLKKTSLGQLKVGDAVNLERAMILGTRNRHMYWGKGRKWQLDLFFFLRCIQWEPNHRKRFNYYRRHKFNCC